MSVERRRRKRPWYRRHRRILSVLLVSGLAAWFAFRPEPPPQNPGDLCAIFDEKRSWYRAAKRSYETWGVPEAVQMAVIHRESGFRARARPPRRWIWGFIPGPRLSSAYGYAQAIDATWEAFEQSIGHDASRYRFGDVARFVGWYGDRIHRLTGIPKDDAYRLYLAYHEGPAGYQRGSHERKPWLLAVARKVERRARTYQSQYDLCADSLVRPWEWLIWPAVAVLLLWLLSLWIQGRRRRPRRR